jgi:hypothetical protein
VSPTATPRSQARPLHRRPLAAPASRLTAPSAGHARRIPLTVSRNSWVRPLLLAKQTGALSTNCRLSSGPVRSEYCDISGRPGIRHLRRCRLHERSVAIDLTPQGEALRRQALLPTAPEAATTPDGRDLRRARHSVPHCCDGGQGRVPCAPPEAAKRGRRTHTERRRQICGRARGIRRTGAFLEGCHARQDGQPGSGGNPAPLSSQTVNGDRASEHITGKSIARATDGSRVNPPGLLRDATGQLTPTMKPLTPETPLKPRSGGDLSRIACRDAHRLTWPVGGDAVTTSVLTPSPPSKRIWR